MASTPEVKVKREIDKILKKHGAKVVNPMPAGMGENGVHDKLVCIRGYFLSVEAKAGNNKPTTLQCQFGRQVWEAGGVAVVINESNLDVLQFICEAYTSGEIEHILTKVPAFREMLEAAGGSPVPFELLRRAAYMSGWRFFLNNDKRVLAGVYPEYEAMLMEREEIKASLGGEQ